MFHRCLTVLWNKAKEVAKSVYGIIKDKLHGLFTARGVLELVVASAIVTISGFFGYTVACMPYNHVTDTVWGHMIMYPLLFGVVAVVGGVCAELLVILVFIGIRHTNDQFIRKVKKRLAKIERGDNAKSNCSNRDSNRSLSDEYSQALLQEDYSV